MVLNDAQQPCLRVEGQFPYFIEKDRAAVGPLEASLVVLEGPGERALGVAEKLAVQKRGGNAAAVHRNEGLVSSGGETVQFRGEKVLAGPGFSGEQYRNVEGGEHPYFPSHVLETRVRAHDVGKAADLLAQGAVVFLREFQDFFHALLLVVEADDEIERLPQFFQKIQLVLGKLLFAGAAEVNAALYLPPVKKVEIQAGRFYLHLTCDDAEEGVHFLARLDVEHLVRAELRPVFENAVDLGARRRLDVFEKAYPVERDVDVAGFLAFVGRSVEKVRQRQNVGQIKEKRVQAFFQRVFLNEPLHGAEVGFTSFQYMGAIIFKFRNMGR